MNIYLLIVLPAVLVILVTLVARVEKRMVWPYGKPEAQPQFPDASGYGDRWVSDARGEGFSFLGWSPDLKGPRYQVSYALLASPERDCFVIIGVGTIVGMAIRGTWVYTRATDGRVFYSTDNQSCVEIDVSGRWRSQLVRASAFPELLQRHRDLLRDRGVTAQPFSAGREAEDFRSMREDHYRTMSNQGLIAFTDVSATHWRYTVWGAFKVAILNFSIGLLRAVSFGRIPRSG